jgi:hypothetical protein
MTSPELTPDQIAELSSLVAEYITVQREKALPLALPLSLAQRASMDGFFLPQVFDTRLLVLTESRVEKPPFYVPLRRMGFTNLPSFSTMAAVTFCDVVVSHQPFSDGLLFHELVHVEQYRQLGIPHFADVSTASLSETKSMLSPSSSSSTWRKCLVLLAILSSERISSTSHFPWRASAISESSPGRRALTPEEPRSMYSRPMLNLRAAASSRS